MVNKIKVLSSEVAIKCMEDELVKIDAEIAVLEDEKQKAATNKPLDIRIVLTNVRYLMKRLHELLLQQSNPVAKAEYFSLLFDKPPTYAQLVSGTQNPTQITGINELFQLINVNVSSLVSLTTKQAETFFGELEYLEPQLNVLDID